MLLKPVTTPNQIKAGYKLPGRIDTTDTREGVRWLEHSFCKKNEKSNWQSMKPNNWSLISLITCKPTNRKQHTYIAHENGQADISGLHKYLI